jgi:N-acetylmuramoyl-L-alanine amidase
MKRLRPVFLLALTCVLSAAGVSARAEQLQVVKSKKYWGQVEALEFGKERYISAKDGARIYGGQLYWYAVRGTVRISIRGRQVVLTKDAPTAVIDGRDAEIETPMIVRAGKAFVPLNFFVSRAFAGAAGVESKYDPQKQLLTIEPRSSVGPLRWFSYPGYTRVVLEIDDSMRFQTAKRGRSGFEVMVPNGRIGGPQRIDVGDGVVDFVRLSQESKQARLTLKTGKSAVGHKFLELQKPHRVVIDVMRSKDAVLAAKKRRVEYEAPASPRQKRRERKRERRSDAKRASSAKLEAPAPKAVSPKKSPEPASVPAAVSMGLSGRAGRFRIMIDPGHGGKDGGAVGRRGTLEKDINLRASLALAEMLREKGGFDVKLTRSDDRFIKLGHRSKLANNFNADLFVSIHCNAAEQRSLSGFEVYFLSERASDPEAERLAEFENSVLALEGEDVVLDEAAQILYGMAKTENINAAAELAGLMTQSLSKRVDLRNRGVKQAAFYVLRGANQPAVLVELAFLSHSKDETKLRSKKYLRKLVEGVHAGILEYVKRNGAREAKR